MCVFIFLWGHFWRSTISPVSYERFPMKGAINAEFVTCIVVSMESLSNLHIYIVHRIERKYFTMTLISLHILNKTNMHSIVINRIIYE